MKDKKKRSHMKFLTRLMIMVIIISLGTMGYCSYDVFFKKLQVVEASEVVREENPELQAKREAQEAKKEENSGIIAYVMAGDNAYGEVIRDQNDAKEALKSMQSELGINDVDEEYECSDEKNTENIIVYEMQQYYGTIPVYGYSLMVTADKNGTLLSVTGTYGDVWGIDTDTVLGEYDAEDKAKDYLKSEYALDDNEYNLNSKGKVIFFLGEEAFVGYEFEICPKGSNSVIQRIFLDGDTGDVLSDCSLINYNEMISGTLQGQTGSQKLDYYSVNDDTYQLKDTERNITVYSTIAPYEDSSNFPDGGDNSELIEWDSSESPDPDGVDALANLEKAYDYYLNTFGRYGTTNNKSGELNVLIGLCALKNEKNEIEYYYDNAFMSGTDIMAFTIMLDASEATYSSHLDVVGHEYNHGVVSGSSSLLEGNYETTDERQKSSQLAISEGLADVFGEFLEDYSDDGLYNGSCDWKNAVRSAKNPSGSSLTDADDFIECTTDCHDGATIISHPAYLMAAGIGGDSSKAISDTKILADMWYEVIQQTNSKTSFTSLRHLFELSAMRNYNSGKLTASQLEGVLDAFDSVGISHMYDYALETSSEIRVYDQNNELYNNYKITVSRMQSSEVVLSQDVHDTAYNLNLEPGLYTVTLTDLNNEDLSFDMSLIVNDNEDENKNDPYSGEADILTEFGEDPRDVVLVLDVSGSMGGTPLEETKDAALKFVETVLDESPATRISLVTYSYQASLIVADSNSKSALSKAINSLESGGNTNMYDAVEMAWNLLSIKHSDTKIIVLMSDGQPNEGENQSGDYQQPIIDIASKIKSTGILIYTLGFFHSLGGTDLDECQTLMASVASPGYSFDVQDSDSIQFVFDDIAQQVSGQDYIYIRIECPVDVTVKKDGETLSSARKSQNIRTSFGTLTFEGDDDGDKVLRLLAGENYEICINGTGIGKMDYSVSFPDEDGNYSDVRSFSGIEVTSDMIAVSDTNRDGATELKVDSDGDGLFDYNYSASENCEAVEKIDYLPYILMGVAILLVALWLVFEIIGLCKYLKQKIQSKKIPAATFCHQCGASLNAKDMFCAKCGTPANHQQPQSYDESSKSEKRKAPLIAKLVTIGVMVIISYLTVIIYRSSPTGVYQQIFKQQYTSAQMMYESNIEGRKIPDFYLNTLVKYHLRRIENASEKENISTEAAQTVYQEISQMDIGSASELAERYMNG